ncbi:hypothetical protein BS78_04G052900 [Paspalum vaginatum]|nr:hypothetical protein BS78_04G052900 [Paspalum vaginatum]
MMKGKITAIAALMLLLLTLGAEASVCKSHSSTFKGQCHHNTVCAAVCMSEGSGGGSCEGMIHRKCMCTHDCGSGGDGGGSSSGGGAQPPSAVFTAGGRRAGGHA